MFVTTNPIYNSNNLFYNSSVALAHTRIWREEKIGECIGHY